jgi:hypothetical protein
VLKASPYAIDKPHVGFLWNRGDVFTSEWRPQGITGLQHDDRKYLAVTWYHRHPADRSKNVKGVRLSIVDVTDMDRVRYRHVLLVEPTSDPEKYPVYQPITIHAGGVAAVGSLLFVVDTKYGMRVFDVNQAFAVLADDSKSKCGVHDGKPYAFNYGYILPQTVKYGLANSNFSFVSHDSTNGRLITGNFHYPAEGWNNSSPHLSWWVLNSDHEIVECDRRLTEGLPERAQGVNRVQTGDATYLMISTSYGKERGKLFVKKDEPAAEWKEFRWPKGAEDLHYSAASGNLWSLTEFKPTRVVFAVKAIEYIP